MALKAILNVVDVYNVIPIISSQKVHKMFFGGLSA
jgi:hypothetical protein